MLRFFVTRCLTRHFQILYPTNLILWFFFFSLNRTLKDTDFPSGGILFQRFVYKKIITNGNWFYICLFLGYLGYKGKTRLIP